ERLDRNHVVPSLAAEGARIHRKRPAQGARNAGEELRGPESPLHALLRELCASDAAPASNLLLADPLELVEDAVRIDYDAAKTASAHEQVAAETAPENRRRRVETADELRQVVRIVRREEHVRGAADVPRRMARHRLVLAHASLEVRRQRERVHACLPSDAALNV